MTCHVEHSMSLHHSPFAAALPHEHGACGPSSYTGSSAIALGKPARDELENLVPRLAAVAQSYRFVLRER